MLWIAIVLLGGLAADDRPRPAWVAVDQAELFVEPDEASATTNRLRKGRRLEVVREGPGGWLAVEPPPGSFSWVDRDAIEDLGDGRARVVRERAAVRPGVEGASLPAGLWTIVPRGGELELLDLAPLVLRQADGTRRVLYAVRPPPGELRHIRSEDVTRVDPRALGEEGAAPDPDLIPAPIRGRRRLASGPGARVPSIDPDFLAVGPPARELGLARWFDEELARVEARHRAVLAAPLDSWSLESVRGEYEALAARAAGATEREAVALRMRQLERQRAAARAARRLAELAASTRRRDEELAAIGHRLGELATGATAAYEAEGLLQPTSELVDGRRAYVLVGDDGRTETYLLAPPGLDLSRYVAARVGVRGDSRFHDVRKARVITVREIEPLDEAP